MTDITASSSTESLVVTKDNLLVISGSGSGDGPVVLNWAQLVLEDGAQVIVQTEVTLNAQSTVSRGTATFLFSGSNGAPGANGASGSTGAAGANGQPGQDAPGGELNLGVASGSFVFIVQPGNGGAGGNGGNGKPGGGGAGGSGGNGGNGSIVNVFYTPGDPAPRFQVNTNGGIGGQGGAGGNGSPAGPAGNAGANGSQGQVVIRQQ